MKFFKSFKVFGWLPLMMFCAASCFTACSDDDPATPTTPPSLSIQQPEVNVGHAGGQLSVVCKIANPVQSATIEVSTDQPEWVTQLTATPEGVINFYVMPNTSETNRTAVVTVNYSKAESASFKVIQSGVSDPFTITAGELSESKINATIKPADEKMRYMVMILPKSQADACPDDEQLYKDDMLFLKDRADKLLTTLDRLIEATSHVGTKQLSWEDLDPMTPYCIYTYGITLEGKRLTPITRAIITTTRPGGLDTKFEIDYKVNGVEVDMSVTPSNDKNFYLFNLEDGALSDQDLLKSATTFVNQMLYEYGKYGYTREQAVEDMSFRGPGSLSFKNNTPETTYRGFAIALSPSGMLSDKITVKDVTTGPILQSENVFNCNVTNVKPRSALLEVEPSNSDPYVMVLVKASDYAHLDEQGIKNVLSNFLVQGYIQTFRGFYSSVFEGLQPTTEYELMVMGVNGCYPSTALSRVKFTTPESHSTNAQIELKFDKYFSAADAAAKYPGYFDNLRQFAILPVQAVATNGGVKVRYKVYEDDVTDRSKFTDDVMINDLQNGGETSPRMDFFCNFGKTLTVAGVAEDADGNFGPTFRQKISLSTSGVSPIDEYDFQPPKKAPRIASYLFQPENRVVLLGKPLPAKTPAMRMAEFLKGYKIKPYKKDIMRRVLPIMK